MKPTLLPLATFLALAASAPCLAGPPAGAAPAARLLVFVSVPPQAYFAQRVAGARASVSTLAGPGRDPHSYEPTPRQVAELGAASIWFTVGVEFEKALRPRISSLYPALRVVDSAAGAPRRRLEAHGHGAGDAEEGGLDPHVWLGRAGAKEIARAMRDALAALDPAGAPAYSANYEAFAREVDSTFDSLARELGPLRGKPVFVYHPAFGYFLDEFGIAQEAVETGGKEPTQKGLAELAARARAEGAKAVFVQAQFPTAAARTLAKAIGGEVAALDALEPDWLENLRRMGAALARAAR